MVFLPIFALNFHSRVCKTTTFLLKIVPHVKYERNLLIMPVSLLFHNIGPNFAQILPQDHTHFDFFAGLEYNVLGDSIKINNFNYNPVVLKNIC